MKYAPMKASICLTITALCLASATFANATDWVDAGPSLDGDAKIQLNKVFSNKSGKFQATPESMLDKRNSINGNFVVGTYRYVYKAPEQDNGKWMDEMISTEIMDCTNKFYSTLKQIKKFQGKIISEKSTPDADVQMMQINSSNIDSQLCSLHAGQKTTPINTSAVTNPSYKPNMTDKDMDALMDKYAPAKAKK